MSQPLIHQQPRESGVTIPHPMIHKLQHAP